MQQNIITPRIYGTETEFSLVARNADGKVVNNYELYDPLVTHLPEGLYIRNDFTSNGGRLYLDQGEHIEWSTPECTSAQQAIVYEVAGEQIMLHGLNKLTQSGWIKDYHLNKRVTDGREFWGAHENYQIPRTSNPAETWGNFLRGLAAVLAVRNVLVGSGYVANNGRYCVAQKSESTWELSNGSTTSSRPLVNCRDESWDREDKRRLHVVAGDANILPWSATLKLGIVALYLRLYEAGIWMDDLYLADPVKAARMIGKDTSTQRPVLLEDKTTIRPISVLEKLAAKARLYSERQKLPPDELEIIDMLERGCEDLQLDPSRLIGRSDWITRKALVDRMRSNSVSVSIDSLRAKDMQYDQLGDRPGTGSKLRTKSKEFMDKVEMAIVRPPADTRARLRGRVIVATQLDNKLDESLKRIEWDKIAIRNGPELKLDPLHTYSNQLDILIGEEPLMGLAAF